MREAGAARTSVLMGTAPLVAVAIALTVLGEPVSAALLVGAGLIVAGGFALANERVRPEDFRRLGVLFAVGATVFFAVRDNVLRAIARDTSVGRARRRTDLAARRRGDGSDLPPDHAARRVEPGLRHHAVRAFTSAGLLFGLSYTALFQGGITGAA